MNNSMKTYLSMVSLYLSTDIMDDIVAKEERQARPQLPRYKYTFTIPEGTKLYLFNTHGAFEAVTEFADRNEMPHCYVYWCVARTYESAQRKYINYLKNN